MNSLRQLVSGLLTGLLSTVLVLGALSLSVIEGGNIIFLPTPTETAVPVTLQPGEPSPTPYPTATPLPPTQCPPPSGWVPLTVQGGDTLIDLAAQFQVSVEDLSKANCLFTSQLTPGTVIFVPPLPTPTATRASEPERPTATEPQPTVKVCGPPPGWVIYIVKPGDTLYRLSRILGVTVADLQLANCLSNPSAIQAGMPLYVPFLPITPTFTPTRTSTKTSIPPSITPVPPSPTFTHTPVPPSFTPVPPTPTFTSEPPTETFTPSPIPTDTPVPSETPTSTP